MAVAVATAILAMLLGLIVSAGAQVEPAENKEADEDVTSGGSTWTTAADIEYTSERIAGVGSSEVTFDEVGLALTGGWWEGETGIKYEADGGRGLRVEEFAVRLGGIDTFPWFVQAGRTIVPFGRYESSFVEDPLVALVGETDADSIVLGLKREDHEVSVAGFRGAVSSRLRWAASAELQATDRWSLGLSWSSAIPESVELADLRREREEERLTMPSPLDAIDGVGGWLAFVREPFAATIEVVSATSLLPAGGLGTTELRPAAGNLEVSLRTPTRWEIAGRFELAEDLPLSPARQFGVAVTCELGSPLALTAEYLRAEFTREGPRRDLVSMKLALEY